MSVIIYFVSIMSSATFARGRGQSSDVFIEVVLQLCSQTSILTAMEQRDPASLAHVRVTLLCTGMLCSTLFLIILHSNWCHQGRIEKEGMQLSITPVG